MGVNIPRDILDKAQLTPEEFLIEIAAHLYNMGKLTLGQAIKFAQLQQIEFQKELAKRNIYIKYDRESLNEDLQTIKELKELKDK